jgi:hypothetical protein
VVLSTNQKGAIAETAILHEATKCGIVVYRPAVEGARADMIFEVGPRLLRVQCKWARLLDRVVQIRAQTCLRSRCSPTGRTSTSVSARRKTTSGDLYTGPTSTALGL